LQLNKIVATALKTNPGSWRVMENIGLTYEGTLKQHVYRFDKFFDLVTYGFLQEEYLKGS
jgi:ribosomal-protein-alanine N-acetyltransferase